MSTSAVSLGATLDSINGYTTDYTTLGQDFFLKHNIGNDNTVESNEICHLLNSHLYCLKGGSSDYYEENVNILYESFGEEKCSMSSGNAHCSESVLNASVSESGGVYAGDVGSSCYVTSTGDAYCRTNNGGGSV